MKTHHLLLIMIVVLFIQFGCMNNSNPLSANSPPDVLWTRTFGGDSYDYAYQVIETLDGGYAIVGRTDSYGEGGSDGWLIKTDQDGNLKWSKTFGGGARDEIVTIKQLPDSNFIMAGYTNSSGAGNADAWLIKTDKNGNTIWEKTFGGSSDDKAMCVEPTSDGGYILSGYTLSTNFGGQGAWIIKTDNQGNLIWSKTFGNKDNVAKLIHQMPDQGFLFGINSVDFFGNENGKASIVRTDQYGNQIRLNPIIIDSSDNRSSVFSINDEEVIAIVRSSFCKFSSGGNLNWIKSIGQGMYTSAIFYSAIKTDHNGYALTGKSFIQNSGKNPFYVLVKFNPSGDGEWIEMFARDIKYGRSDDHFSSVIQTRVGAYVAAGQCREEGKSAQFFLAKVARNGCERVVKQKDKK